MYVKVQFRQNSELNLENQRMSYLKSWIFYEYESLQKKLQKNSWKFKYDYSSKV